MTARVLFAAGLAVAASASLAAGQVFRASTDTVLLSVTVTNPSTGLVTGLDRDDFQVLENGQLQDVSVFSRDPQPISLSLLIDASVSMDKKMHAVQEAAIGFCRRLRDDDLAQIVEFNEDVRVRQTFTNDTGALERAVRQVRATGSTSLYTAIYVALAELEKTRVPSSERIRRQALIVLSDGEDTTSLLTFDDVLDRAKRSTVAIYAIKMRERPSGSDAGFNNADFVLRSLSRDTGGRLFLIDHVSQLASAYEQIADELANQYILGYTPKNPKRDGGWRTVTVRTSQPGTSARTRAGYFVPSQPR